MKWTHNVIISKYIYVYIYICKNRLKKFLKLNDIMYALHIVMNIAE
jgi:hypothetical protein